LTQLQTRLENTTEELEKFKSNNCELEKLIAEKSDVESRLLVEFETLQTKLRESELNVSNIKFENKITKSELEYLSNEKSRLQTCVKTLVSGINELQGCVVEDEELAAGEAKDPLIDIEFTSESFPDHVQSKLCYLKQLTSAMTSQSKKLHLDFKQTMDQLSESESKCRKLASELETSQHDYATLVERCNNAQSSSEQNTALIAALEVEKKNLVSQLDELEVENCEHKSLFAQLNEQLSASKLECTSLHSHSVQLETDVEKLKSDYDQIKDKLTLAEQALADSISINDQLKRKTEELEAEVRRCKSMLEDSCASEKQLEDELDSSKQQLESLRETAASQAQTLRYVSGFLLDKLTIIIKQRIIKMFAPTQFSEYCTNHKD